MPTAPGNAGSDFPAKAELAGSLRGFDPSHDPSIDLRDLGLAKEAGIRLVGAILIPAAAKRIDFRSRL